ncbi:MAG: hypothetical protein ACRDTT_14865 [Pseudonocardiaceae bacterium]
MEDIVASGQESLQTIRTDPRWAPVKAIADQKASVAPQGVFAWAYYGVEQTWSAAVDTVVVQIRFRASCWRSWSPTAQSPT